MSGRANNVRFWLDVEGREPIAIPEPVNYDEGNGYVYSLEDESGGILITRDNSLEYFGTAYETLVGLYATDGIITQVRERKEVKNPMRMDEKWTNAGNVFLDMSDMGVDETKKTVATGTIQGGLKKQLDDAWGEEYDLTNTLSNEETNIGNPDTIDVNIDSRRIFQRSKLFIPKDLDDNDLLVEDFWAWAIPFQYDYKSDESVSSIFQPNATPVLTPQLSDTGNIGAIFYFNANTDKTIRVRGRFKVYQDGITPIHDGNHLFYLGFPIYDEDLNLLRIEDAIIPNINNEANIYPGNPGYVEPTTSPTSVDVYIDQTIDLLKGESFSFIKWVFSPYQYRYSEETTFFIENNSTYPASVSRAFLPKNLFERLIACATGSKMRFKSNLFETGEMSLLATAPIWWIRQFPDIINEGTDEERRIQAVMSLQDAYDSYYAVKPLAWWIEMDGDTEVMRIELKSYTRQNFIGIHYGKKISEGVYQYYDVDDYNWDTLPDNFHKTLTLGSEIGGDNYEEVEGLRSVSGQATFKTINTNGGNDYKKVSKIAMAAEYAEIPRRKPFDEYPDEDTRFDANWVFLYLKIVNGSFFLRKWDDDFETPPTGIYDVESAWNLKLTPAQLLINHEEDIKIGLYQIKYSDRNIRWISSDCNSSLITKKAGEDSLEESGTIAHSRLANPKVIPVLDKFKFQIDFEMEEQINGTTTINNEEVPNWFGLVAYQKNGIVSYGRLIRVDTNNEGSNEIVQAFIR